MARRYEFYLPVAEMISFLPLEHKIHTSIFEPTCNVLFIIWRPDEVDIADFYFIVSVRLHRKYKAPVSRI